MLLAADLFFRSGRWRRLAVGCAVGSLAWAADGANELTNPADVRARREATRGREVQRPRSETQDPPASSPAAPATSAATAPAKQVPADESLPWTAPAAPPPAAPRPPLVRPTLVVGVEQGWYDMAIENGTDPSAGGGSLGTAYAVGYQIEAFTMTTIRSSARIDDWGFSALAGANEADGEVGSTLAGVIQRYDSDESGWWEAAVSWASLRGFATTVTAAGERLEDAIDSTWRRVAVERRGYPMLCWGVAYEDFAMPSAYSLDDPDGQVLAFFDTDTRWRTVSAHLGLDSVIAATLERREGWMPLYEVRVGLGCGSLSYDAGAVERSAGGYGYQVDDSSGFVMTARAEGVLGLALAGAWQGLWCQAAIGGRLHGAWYSTLTEHDEENPTSATYDTLVLNSEVSVVSYGVFARVSLVW